MVSILASRGWSWIPKEINLNYVPCSDHNCNAPSWLTSWHQQGREFQISMDLNYRALQHAYRLTGAYSWIFRLVLFLLSSNTNFKELRIFLLVPGPSSPLPGQLINDSSICFLLIILGHIYISSLWKSPKEGLRLDYKGGVFLKKQI